MARKRKNEIPEEQDDRPITTLHIPAHMVIDPDKPPPPPKRDKVMTALTAFSVASWLLIIAALICVAQARPRYFALFEALLDKSQGYQSWTTSLLMFAVALLAVNMAVCLAGIALRVYKKQPFDRRMLSFVLLGVLSLVLMLVLIFMW